VPVRSSFIFAEVLMQAEINIEGSTTNIKRRKDLIPLWIKIFGWFFIVLGALATLGYCASLMFGFEASYEIFGFSYSGNAYSLMPAFLVLAISVNGASAFGLLFHKDWGLNACLVMGYIGLFLTLASMLLSLPGIHIRLEPLIQIPYLIKLHKIKSQW